MLLTTIRKSFILSCLELEIVQMYGALALQSIRMQYRFKSSIRYWNCAKHVKEQHVIPCVLSTFPKVLTQNLPSEL